MRSACERIIFKYTAQGPHISYHNRFVNVNLFHPYLAELSRRFTTISWLSRDIASEVAGIFCILLRKGTFDEGGVGGLPSHYGDGVLTGCDVLHCRATVRSLIISNNGLRAFAGQLDRVVLFTPIRICSVNADKKQEPITPIKILQSGVDIATHITPSNTYAYCTLQNVTTRSS